ncbi:MAG: magnesium and cobalt transport protein CorA [Marine Group III euryarchaeote CG-Bathy2]|uniref:Magnesium transport protein CorA n=4 Tax=Methanobacteriati TaxID=3366610 RepID=A0A075HBX1_9EURY|nr:magnesium transporter (corA) [uncultured marine group II/III euryarchaeote KM3_15_B02]AIF07136.1 magnesium transporter (corA) [uncultured marine group II/III euryarchaeote KM3_200_A03]AIF14031.1 magnesium transporter (corA) [uncultured marine group II/III euryarchaeote KM3_65_G10]OIR12567.1 MAG: magnesium and cobalt transport protein CorA [Marine Group III euryarchaeote CG-Bathy2]
MSTIRLLTAASGKAGEQTLPLDELGTELEGVQSGWLDILQPGDDAKEFLLETMGFHPLAVEDCFADPVDRAEHYEDHRFVVLRARDADSELDTEYLLAFLTGSLLVTVRHTALPAMNRFRERYRSHRRMRRLQRGPEFLLYELLDAVADDWLHVLEGYSQRLDDLEDRVFDPATEYPGLLEALHEMKQDLREMSKSVTPLQETVARLLRPDEEFISEANYLYFRDLADVIHGLVNRVENYSAGVSSTRDAYLSQVSMRLGESNARLTEVMTTLTIIATIMLPLTLIAGIFGMNTDQLPLAQGNGFWLILGLMGAFAGGMLYWFWRRGWLGRQA